MKTKEQVNLASYWMPICTAKRACFLLAKPFFNKKNGQKYLTLIAAVTISKRCTTSVGS